MDEEYWKGQVDAKLDFIKEQLTYAKETLLTSNAKNDTDHERIKEELSNLKIKSSIWGAVTGAMGATGALIAKYLFIK